MTNKARKFDGMKVVHFGLLSSFFPTGKYGQQRVFYVSVSFHHDIEKEIVQLRDCISQEKSPCLLES